MNKTFVLTILAVVISACGQSERTPDANVDEQPAASATADTSIYAAALASESRTDSDRAKDAMRRPDAVLEFFGIQPGDTVLEMWAGGGYYTELLSHVVGEDGKVVAHMNTPILNFTQEEHAARHANGRLANTDVVFAENNALMFDEERFDAATIILNFHDIYWESEQYAWEKIDAPAFLLELCKAIKPGGKLGIVDHRAAAGSPSEVGATLHRFDPALLIEQLEGAGFVFEGESDVLANPDDDYAVNVFDESVRGKTDRFVLRFRRPE